MKEIPCCGDCRSAVPASRQFPRPAHSSGLNTGSKSCPPRKGCMPGGSRRFFGMPPLWLSRAGEMVSCFSSRYILQDVGLQAPFGVHLLEAGVLRLHLLHSGLIPNSRHDAGTACPPSAHFSASMIWLFETLDFFCRTALMRKFYFQPPLWPEGFPLQIM
jgi:hypothetical protein